MKKERHFKGVYVFVVASVVLLMMGCTKTKKENHEDPEFNALLERANGYAYPSDTMNLDSVRQMALTLLDHDSVAANDGNRMQVLRLLTDEARIRQDYEVQLKWATQLADLCRENQMQTEALRTESEIGYVLTHLGQREEGLAMLNAVISQLYSKRAHSPSSMPASLP